MSASLSDLSTVPLSEYLSSRGTPVVVDPGNPSAPADSAKLAAFHAAVNSRGAVCVVLAAGQGSRFIAAHPKVVHPFLGRPLLSYALDASNLAKLPAVVVVGHEREKVCKTIEQHALTHTDKDSRRHERAYIVQEEQMGTGHAVYLAKFALPDDFQGDIIVMYADNPGVDGHLLETLLSEHEQNKKTFGHKYQAMIVTGSRASAGAGADAYGRIVRARKDEGPVLDIVEKKTIKQLASSNQTRVYGDVVWTADELDALDEFNSGIVVANSSSYLNTLGTVLASPTKLEPPKYEYYATDIVKGIVAQEFVVEGWTLPAEQMWKLEGANTLEELKELEDKHQGRSELATASNASDAGAFDQTRSDQVIAIHQDDAQDLVKAVDGHHGSNDVPVTSVLESPSLDSNNDDNSVNQVAIEEHVTSDVKKVICANGASQPAGLLEKAEEESERVAKKQRLDEL